jgi:hypothetical protein
MKERAAHCQAYVSGLCKRQVVGCKAPSQDLAADVAAALSAETAGDVRVVIACSHFDQALDGTNAGFAREVEQLQAVQRAVEAQPGLHSVVYASEGKPLGAAVQSGSRRSLLQAYTGFGPYQGCGILCQARKDSIDCTGWVGVSANPTCFI